MLELGLVPAGSALASALFPYAAQRNPVGGLGSAAGGLSADVAFAIRFLAHVVWLELLFGTAEVPAAGGDLGALMVAAAAVDRRLVYPRDVEAQGDLGRQMALVLAHWEPAARSEHPERFRMAVDVSRRAASATASFVKTWKT